jgi:Phosphotransferase enzyme family
MSDPHDSQKTAGIPGFSIAELRPIAEAIARPRKVVRFSVDVDGQDGSSRRGRNCNRTVTFSLETDLGARESSGCFVKWNSSPFLTDGKPISPSEATHYDRLRKLGAPIPAIYGVLSDSDNREVLFLEQLLPFSGTNDGVLSREDLLVQFLELVARFNAISLPREYRSLPNSKKGKSEARPQQREPLSDLVKRASDHDLRKGGNQICVGSTQNLARLEHLEDNARTSALGMKEGLLHNDCYPKNVGWRPNTREPLLFDLEVVSAGPRFSDVARWVGPPDDVQLRCLTRRSLARRYLQEYTRAAGDQVSIEDFLDQTRALWLARLFGELRWHIMSGILDESGDLGNRQQSAAWHWAEIDRALATLLRQVS